MFSERLRRRRLELGISQEELARLVGYKSRSSISKLESGCCDISQSKLRLLAGVLNTTPEELIGENADRFISPSINKTLENKSGKVVALIQAGGKSTRNMLNIPNQFVNVDDKPVIVYVLEAYEKHPSIDEIDVVCLYGWEKTLLSYCKQYHITKLNKIVTGGYSIIDSIRIGLNAIKDSLHDDDTVILQEATRPMINASLISKLLSSFNEFGSSVYVRSMNDFPQIRVVDDSTELADRNTMYSLESPEIYSYGVLKEAFQRQINEVKDDGSCCVVMMHRLGIPIHLCESTSVNLKIVKQEDIYIFKVLNQVLL